MTSLYVLAVCPDVRPRHTARNRPIRQSRSGSVRVYVAPVIPRPAHSAMRHWTRAGNELRTSCTLQPSPLVPAGSVGGGAAGKGSPLAGTRSTGQPQRVLI